MLETKSQSLHLVNPWRTEHIRRPTRGKSGEIQELWDNLERAILMLEGHVSQPKVVLVSPGTADHAKSDTYVISGTDLIPFGWRQSRVSIPQTTDVVNNTLEWRAVQPGAAGDDIMVRYINNGGATAVDWNPSTKVITVGLTLAGAITAANVITALAGSVTGAQYVVQAQHAFGSSGAGHIHDAVPATHLVGGAGKALRRASLTINPAGANNALVWTARKPGSDGEMISVEYTAGLGGGLLPVITVLGSHILVLLKAGVTTANDVLRSLEASENARRLVEVHLLYGESGAGTLPGAVLVASLANGGPSNAVEFIVGGLAGAITNITETTIAAELTAVTGAAVADTVLAELNLCGFRHEAWLAGI